MSKIINLEDFKNKKVYKIKDETNINRTKAERMEAKRSLLHDDDKYVLAMLSEEELREM